MKRDKPHILHLPSWYLPEGGEFCRSQVQALNETENVYAAILANVPISMRKYGLKKYFSLPHGFFLSHEDDIDVFRNYHLTLPKFREKAGKRWSDVSLKMFEEYCNKYGKPDLIHAHSVLWAGYTAKLIKEKYNIPYVITEHKGIFGLSCQFAIDSFQDWEEPYMQEAFSNAERVITVSEKLIPKIKSLLKKNVPISVLSNTVDTSFFHYIERPENTIIHCICVNGFRYVKAYDILLPAFDNVCEKVKNLQLTLLGEDFEGKEFNKLWKSVKNKDKINFTGFLDESGVRNHLWKSDFFIIPSRVESQSVSVIEALSTGLPIVCTEVIPEQIANETNAIRVPVENVEKLTDAIIEMCGKYKEYDGKSIAKEIKEITDKKVIAKSLIDFYTEILEK